MPSQLTQESLLRALLLLRKTHPHLPRVTWEIPVYPQFGMRGFAFGPADDRATLDAYAEALGGAVESAYEYADPQRGPMLSLILRTAFADVPVEIRSAIPAAAKAVA